MRRPLVPLTIAVIAGISVGYYHTIPEAPLLAALACVLLVLLMALRNNAKQLVIPLSSCAFFIIGIMNINLALYQSPAQNHLVHQIGDEKITIEGIVVETPEEAPERTSAIIAVRNIIREDRLLPAEGLVMLSLYIEYPLKYGDLIRFRSHLRKPRNFHNPGGFDYEKYLRGQGILVQGAIASPADIVLIRKDCGNPLRTSLERVRSRLRTLIINNAPTPQGEIIRALLLGETKQIPLAVRDTFNRTGTSHILAISGINVAMVASFTIFLTLLVMKAFPALLLRFNAVRISTLMALPPIMIYTLIAGMGISVIRAAIMLLVFLIAVLLRKERDMFNTLALAALLILLVSPTSLFDISFQLSFVAVASLLFAVPLLSGLYPDDQRDGQSWSLLLMRKVGKTLTLFLLVSLSAILGTLPLVIHAFNGFSTVSLIANIIVVPLMGMVTLAIGMAVLLAAPFAPAVAAALVKLASLSLTPSLAAINFFASLPFSYLRVATPSLLEITFYYILLISSVVMIGTRNNRKAPETDKRATQGILLKSALCLSLLFFLFDIVSLSVRDQLRSGLQITAIDVGQGSATLIRLPGGKNMLIDGGGNAKGSFDVGKYVLAPYLWRQRITRLEAVILTHPHPDHLQGLLYILENFTVREAWTGMYPAAGNELYDRFLNIVEERGIVHRILDKEKTPPAIGGGIISVLSPRAGKAGKLSPADIDETNDRSLVIRLVFGERSFLFPGDISGAVEERLVTENRDLQSHVLFVPHHGSGTSSTTSFLKAVRPEAAVISCGADNVFHLPHRNVLMRLAALPVRVYRTDVHGAIELTTDGHDLKITTAISDNYR